MHAPQVVMRLRDVLIRDDVGDHLNAAAHRAPAAARQADVFSESARALLDDGVAEAVGVLAFHVPGRIEVLGKHTDYAGGRSLTCAAERGVAFVVVPGDEAMLHVRAVDVGEQQSFEIRPGLEPGGGWANYATTVARRVARNFGGTLRGGHIAFSSTLPPASGLSSSSALITGFFLALRAINGLEDHSAYRQHVTSCEDLAQYLGCVENGQTFGNLTGDRGVGTFGGSEDHTAILCSKPGMLRLYRYAPTRLEHAVPMPEGYVFAIASSGVMAEKTGAAQARYNRAAHLAAAAADLWRGATGRDDPHFAAALAGPGFDLAEFRYLLRRAEPVLPGVLDRFEQFYLEDQQIIPEAVEALAEGDVVRFGACVDRSQEAAERLLRNQVDETIFLACEARQLGAVAASAFGAGFGGSVWALVEEETADDFTSAWERRYGEAFPEVAPRARFFIERPGPAAFRVAG